MGLFGLFIGLAPAAGTNAWWSMAIVSSIYFIFALGLLKRQGWAWHGTIIYAFLWSFWVITAAYLCDTFGSCFRNLDEHFFIYSFNLIVSLINLIPILILLFLGRKKFWTLSDKGFGIGKSKIFYLLIIFILAISFLSIWSKHQRETAWLCHDSRLIGDVRQLSLALEIYYDDEGGYPQSSGPNFPIESVELYDEDLPVLRNYKNCYYVWVDNTSDNQKVCFYAYSNFDKTYYTASHKGYYECKDKVPTLEDCCFR